MAEMASKEFGKLYQRYVESIKEQSVADLRTRMESLKELLPVACTFTFNGERLTVHLYKLEQVRPILDNWKAKLLEDLRADTPFRKEQLERMVCEIEKTLESQTGVIVDEFLEESRKKWEAFKKIPLKSIQDSMIWYKDDLRKLSSREPRAKLTVEGGRWVVKEEKAQAGADPIFWDVEKVVDFNNKMKAGILGDAEQQVIDAKVEPETFAEDLFLEVDQFYETQSAQVIKELEAEMKESTVKCSEQIIEAKAQFVGKVGAVCERAKMALWGVERLQEGLDAVLESQLRQYFEALRVDISHQSEKIRKRFKEEFDKEMDRIGVTVTTDEPGNDK